MLSGQRLIATTGMASTELPSKSQQEMAALHARAQAEGRVKTARKTRPVDARKATPAEVIVTVIKGEGKETQSKPAPEGSWVVRNRCPETGNEEYLVGADAFKAKYRPGKTAPKDGWQEFEPVGKDVRFFFVTPADGPFSFVAPWGEAMVARPGDAIVQDSEKPAELYRVAKASFACAYDVVGG